MEDISKGWDMELLEVKISHDMNPIVNTIDKSIRTDEAWAMSRELAGYINAYYDLGKITSEERHELEKTLARKRREIIDAKH